MNRDECDYKGCHNRLEENQWQPKNGAKLCPDHAEEFNRMIESEDSAGLVRFGMKTLEQGRKRLSSGR